MDIFLKKSFFRVLLCFLFVFPIVGEAGILKSGIKTVVIGKIAKKALVKSVAKRVPYKKKLKHELSVGKYSTKRIKDPEKGLEYHHMPSGKQMEQYGVKKGDGIVMGMDKLRHRLTRTHSHKNKDILNKNETPREALARDIKDVKNIYKNEKLYDSNVRNSLKEVIRQNKEKHPTLFKKP